MYSALLSGLWRGAGNSAPVEGLVSLVLTRLLAARTRYLMLAYQSGERSKQLQRSVRNTRPRLCCDFSLAHWGGAKLASEVNQMLFIGLSVKKSAYVIFSRGKYFIRPG